MRELDKYSNFVENVTSEPSLDLNVLISRLMELNQLELVNVSQLMTASDGLVAEGGEFKEIVKKILYQGKPLNEDTVIHMKKELGDAIFYWMMGCQAIGEDPYSVIEENVKKLEARYPGGKFSIESSENRKTGDL